MADQVIPRISINQLPTSSWPAGGQANMLGDNFGAQLVSDANAKYYTLAAQGRLFMASNVAAQAVSVALATTYTGLVLYNPASSGKNVVPLLAHYALSVAPAAIASLHLIGGTGTITHTTPLAAPGPRSTLLGSGPVPSAGADSAATIPTPTYLFGVGSGFTAAALYATTPSVIDLGGAIVIPPGAFIAWGALTAVTGFGSFLWAEIPA